MIAMALHFSGAAPVTRASQRLNARDPLAASGRALMLAGAFTTPMGTLRVGVFALSDGLFLAAAVLFACSAIPRPRPSWAFQLALPLAAIATLSASASAVDEAESIVTGIRLLYVWSIWQWGLRGLAGTDRWMKLVVFAFLAGASLSAVVGILQTTGVVQLSVAELVHGRAPGLQFHPNGQGGVLAAAITLCAGLALSSRIRSFALVAGAITATGLLMSGSVSGMVGSVVGIFTALLLGRVKSRLLAGFTVLSIAGAVFIGNFNSYFPGAVSPVDRLLDSTGNGVGESTVATRLATIEYAWARIVDGGLSGVGLDASSGATANGVTLTHSMPFLVLYQGGALMLIAFTIVIVSSIRGAFRRARSHPFDATHVAIASSAIAVLTVAISGPVFYDRWFWFPVLLCAAIASTRLEKDSPS